MGDTHSYFIRVCVCVCVHTHIGTHNGSECNGQKKYTFQSLFIISEVAPRITLDI